MSLQLPTPDDLTSLEEEGLTQEQALQQAGYLFTVATGVKDTPSDPMEQQMLHDAVLQMAWALRARHEDMEAVFSPFSSERIGSYSYSKMQQSVQSGKETGVPLFDAAVSYFRGLVGGAASPLTDSRHIFTRQDGPRGELWVHHDPSYRW